MISSKTSIDMWGTGSCLMCAVYCILYSYVQNNNSHWCCYHDFHTKCSTLASNVEWIKWNNRPFLRRYCPEKWRKFSTRKDLRPQGFEPITLSKKSYVFIVSLTYENTIPDSFKLQSLSNCQYLISIFRIYVWKFTILIYLIFLTVLVVSYL